MAGKGLMTTTTAGNAKQNGGQGPRKRPATRNPAPTSETGVERNLAAAGNEVFYVPPPGHVLMLAADLTIQEAAALSSDDDNWFLDTMPPVLHTYPSVTPANYWELKVSEHRRLVEWAERGRT
jgi:hypothetical protein